MPIAFEAVSGEGAHSLHVTSSRRVYQEADDRHGQECHEKHLGNTHRAGCDTTKAKHRYNDGDGREDYSIVKHGDLFFPWPRATGKRLRQRRCDSSQAFNCSSAWSTVRP